MSICQCDGTKAPPARRLRHPRTPQTHHLGATKTCHIWGSADLQYRSYIIREIHITDSLQTFHLGPLKLAQLCFSAPPPLPQFHLFHLSKRFSCDRVIGGFVRNLTVAAASLCPTLIEIRGDPIREASAGWKKVDF